MDSLDPAHPPVTVIPTPKRPRIWKFWGTCLWGLFVFAAMFVGQLVAIGWFLLRKEGPIDMASAIHVVGGGLTVSWSVIMGLPAVLAALWVAIRISGTRFTDYLALRWPSWTNLLIGVVGLIVVLMGWGFISSTAGHDDAPGFMIDVLKSAEADGALWFLVIAFCVAAPVTEELFARGFLYRGWSESFLGPVGAILLSSAVWTALHLQYDWYFFGEVFSIGLLLGYLRYRFHSIWLTIILHGLNNLAAVVQTILLAGST
jgi:membrane protease YdiL (CAAX protease family)